MKNKKYTRTKINGINTVIYPLKDIFAVNVQLTVKAGSWYEHGKNWGAFHLLEHLIHQGTRKFSNNLEIENFKEKHGLSSNAYTSSDHIKFWVKAPYYSLKPALELLDQLAFQPTIPREKFINEISIITQEYKDKWNNLFTRFDLSLQKQLYGKNHPYLRDGMGQPEYLKKITQQDLLDLHKKFFTARNTQLVIAGKVSSLKAIQLIKETLKPLTGKSVSYKVIPTKTGAKKIIHQEDVQQEQIVITWPLPGYKNLTLKQRLEIDTVRYILGVSQKSILNQEIREKYGLTYRVRASVGLLNQAGYFEVRVSSETKNRQRLIELLRELTYKFINKPVSQVKLKQANAFLDAGTIMNFDSVDNIAQSLSGNLFRYDKLYLPADYLKISKTITPNSIIKTLKKYITPQNELLAVLTKK